MINVILGYLIVFVIICGVFGLTIITGNLFKVEVLKRYLLQIWSFLIFSIVYAVSSLNIRVFDFRNSMSFNNLLLALLAIFPTVIIIYYSDKSKPDNKFIHYDFLDGAVMEIPQRLLAQNLFLVMIGSFQILGFIEISILLNAILWVQFILMQEVLNKRKLSNKVVLEIIASLWFSIFIGILYYRTGNILVPMLCHGLERYLKYILKSRFGTIKRQELQI